VTEFEGDRKRPDGQTTHVRIQILDAGLGEQFRWRVEARDEAGRFATGNPDASLELAIATTHWQELDV
jgi:hypothetical protein